MVCWSSMTRMFNSRAAGMTASLSQSLEGLRRQSLRIPDQRRGGWLPQDFLYDLNTAFLTTGSAAISIEQVDTAIDRLVRQGFSISLLVLYQRIADLRSEQQHTRLAGERPVVQPARLLATDMLGGDGQAFVPEIVLDVFDILVADCHAAFEHIGAAEDLDLQPAAQAATGQDLVDDRFHGVVAEPRDVAQQGIRAVALGQQEVIHAADIDLGIANAGGDAGAENGCQHLVVFGRHVKSTGWNLDDVLLGRAIPDPLDVAAGSRAGIAAGKVGMTGTGLHDTFL